MSHQSIILEQLSFILPQKVCFERFSANIVFQNRIAMIGRNGVGKSTLLKAIQGLVSIEGSIHCPKNIRFGYVSQAMEVEEISGGEGFNFALNEALNEALSGDPDILMLDEPRPFNGS